MTDRRTMTPAQFQLGIEHLVAGGLRLPHGVLPGSYPGGVYAFASAAEWDAYRWNPPEHLVGREGFDGFQAADPDASPKPTWAAIEAAETIEALEAFDVASDELWSPSEGSAGEKEDDDG